MHDLGSGEFSLDSVSENGLIGMYTRCDEISTFLGFVSGVRLAFLRQEGSFGYFDFEIRRGRRPPTFCFESLFMIPVLKIAEDGF